MTKRRRPSRRKPPKKPLDAFLDNVAQMLDTVVSTAVFGAGAVLLGKALGTPPQPSAPLIELPPGLPPEVVAEWERLMGGPDKVASSPAPPPRKGRKQPPIADAEPATTQGRSQPIQLVKGEDGVYRPA